MTGPHAAAKHGLSALSAGMGALLIGLVRGYRLLLSPWLGPRCRYVPTCSRYAIESIERFGPISGGWIAMKRISRCHPWGRWGYDPVPDPEAHEDETRRPHREETREETRA